MNLTDQEALAHIERHVTNSVDPPEEIDARIAAELGVPVDYYFAYLLVWEAVEHYRETMLPPPVVPAEAGPLQWAQALADEIGWTAGRIYQKAAGSGRCGFNAAAGRVIAAAMQLRGCLTQLAAHSNDPRVEVTVDAG